MWALLLARDAEGLEDSGRGDPTHLGGQKRLKHGQPGEQLPADPGADPVGGDLVVSRSFPNKTLSSSPVTSTVRRSVLSTLTFLNAERAAAASHGRRRRRDTCQIPLGRLAGEGVEPAAEACQARADGEDDPGPGMMAIHDGGDDDDGVPLS